MTMTDRSVRSRHLVDPDVAPALDAFTPFSFSAETLPAMRERMGRTVEGAPDPAILYPDVDRSERRVPGANGDPDVRVLHYVPRGRGAMSPALIWMHGGGFVIGSADDDDLVCRRLATETGAVVTSVDYRLAPETSAPGPLHDCYAVLAWVHESADSLGVDRSRIAVGGASAGGGLAACLAILARDRGEIPIGLQLLIYPMLDDRTASIKPASPYAGEFIWTPADNRFGWSALLGAEAGGADVSPYAAAARVESAAGLPPTFISVGSLDLFAEEDVEYAAKLMREGVPTELHVYPGGYHGFNMMPEAWMTKAYYRDFLGALDRHFNRDQS
jgi:acetyl esterase/lipase